MLWIALQPSHEDGREAWGWRALQFTPRVAFVEEAVALEVSAAERLWGGRRALLQKLLDADAGLAAPAWACGRSAPVALALLRLKRAGQPPPRPLPDALPLELLTAATPHLHTLERIGCTTWGGLRALPRAGVSRRFGAGLLQALDAAYGEAPETFAWITAPEQFDATFELAALATSAPELMWAGQRLLSHLQMWLRARNRGLLALELEWTLDLRRLDGKPLPPTESLQLRTAQPTQDVAHLRRLLAEHLSRTTIAAPANHLRMRSLETLPWAGAAGSLLPEDVREGEKLHQLIERLSVRLGEQNVCVPLAHADHRPERMQAWVPARTATAAAAPAPVQEALLPPWLLPQPVPLQVKNHVPQHGGPLQRLARLYRVETGWWEEGGPALRDYFIARSAQAGLVWIYRERPLPTGDARWFLQGIYA